MNKENAHKYLPIIQALAAGKTIEANIGGTSDPMWVQYKEIAFQLPPESYRIRPEPREFWVNIYDDGRNAHLTKALADAAAMPSRRESVLVREVLD